MELTYTLQTFQKGATLESLTGDTYLALTGDQSIGIPGGMRFQAEVDPAAGVRVVVESGARL
jgi:carbamoylphosphate synthase large subunit